MATISKGPGQQETTGDIKDARDPEPTGTYKDPVSGKSLTVTHYAAADALVRMGWELVSDELPRE